MSEFFGLRGALILIGMLVVGGVWLSGVFRGRRPQQARRLRPRRGRDTGRDIIATQEPAHGTMGELPLGTPDMPAVAPLTKGDEAAPERMPSIRRDPDRRGELEAARRNQMELSFSDEATRPAAPDETSILIINIKSTERLIPGNDLVNAVTESGMRFGEMEIFHHYGLAGRTSSQPVFSLANLYEPGTFEIQRMDMFTTRGVTLFMQLPVSSLDGEVACELFLNTAERIANRLECRLFNQSHQTLGAHDLEDMRRTARRYPAVR